MSHHLAASPSNPTGAVEVVHVQSSAATMSPVDGGGAVARPAVTEVAGQSGTRGANLPVENIEQASNAIQRGKADLAQTVGAERRLDVFDTVGGGGGGGGNAGGGQQNANNATGAVAQGTANENVSDQQNGLAAQTSDGTKNVTSTGLPEQDRRSL